MSRVLAGVAALAALLLLRLATAVPPVLEVGLLGLGLAGLAVAAGWRWAASAAAVVFLVAYAAALGIEDRPLAVEPALAFGLSLVLLLGAADLIALTRGAHVQGPVVATTLGRWLGLVGGTLAAALAALALAGRFAAMLPPAVAPLLAAAGALAGVWVLAALIRRAGGGDEAAR
jgi:hypothetical protein